jgi:hypothetical protein
MYLVRKNKQKEDEDSAGQIFNFKNDWDKQSAALTARPSELTT